MVELDETYGLRLVSHYEKLIDRFILKEVTEGKFLNRSLLFHIEDKLAKNTTKRL